MKLEVKRLAPGVKRVCPGRTSNAPAAMEPEVKILIELADSVMPTERSLRERSPS